MASAAAAAGAAAGLKLEDDKDEWCIVTSSSNNADRVTHIKTAMDNIRKGIPPDDKDVPDIKSAITLGVKETGKPYDRLDCSGMIPVSIERDAKNPDSMSISRIGALFEVLVEVPWKVVTESEYLWRDTCKEVYQIKEYFMKDYLYIAVSGPISVYHVDGKRAMRISCNSMDHLIAHLKSYQKTHGVQLTRVGIGHTQEDNPIIYQHTYSLTVGRLYSDLKVPQPTCCAFKYTDAAAKSA